MNTSTLIIGAETPSEYDARMRRLVESYDAMPAARRAMLERIPGWSIQIADALAYVIQNPKV
jgi:hypothetical protein